MAATLTYARAEVLVALRRRRIFALNLLVTGGLTATLVFSAAPPVHATVVLTVLFAFFGTFGSAIPLVRDRETGRLTRLLHAGASPGSLLLQRVAVSTALDFAQLLPAAFILLAAHEPRAAPALLLGLLAALAFSNAIGTWIGVFTRSIGEAALLSSVGAMILLHAAGVFRTPVPNSWGETFEALSPFAFLHDAVRAAFGLPAALSSSAVTTLAIIVAAALASCTIVSRIARDFSTTPRR
ncbi:MAG: ABC transporter permease [Pseudomonas sp.]